MKTTFSKTFRDVFLGTVILKLVGIAAYAFFWLGDFGSVGIDPIPAWLSSLLATVFAVGFFAAVTRLCHVSYQKSRIRQLQCVPVVSTLLVLVGYYAGSVSALIVLCGCLIGTLSAELLFFRRKV